MKKHTVRRLVPVLFSALVLSACTRGGDSSADFAAQTTSFTASDEDFPVIDVHLHPHFDGVPEEITGIMQTKAELSGQMKRAKVVAGVLMEHEGEDPYKDATELNSIVCAGVRDKVNAAAIEKGLKEGHYGCIKIYIGYVWRYAYDPVYEPAYKLAEKYDVPVVFHTGDTYSTTGKLKYADPLTIDEVAVDHPNVRFVIAHLGNPWIQSAAEVAYKNPNVWAEASALMIGNMDKVEPEVAATYLIRPIRWAFGYMENTEKLMFGTDWPLNDIAAYKRAYMRAIPRESWKAVFHDNALKVFPRLKPLVEGKKG